MALWFHSRMAHAPVRSALGLLLPMAGILKAHQLATEPVANTDIFSYRWSLTGRVYFELIFGVWLLSGLHKRLTWVAAVGCFVFFSGVTLYKALSGAATCGCFGKVEVNPWYTLILDASAFALLTDGVVPVVWEGKTPSIGEILHAIPPNYAGGIAAVVSGAANTGSSLTPRTDSGESQ